ncbi:MAG TPA: maleylpyruvate isomerase family mycothiol-dependent enzyme [Streptosporangiaceae bacterium]|nr:maleylpyruvate isomerase family mycothiol-dependent enzyme [Streptosporangiaceae bacterium]
MSDEAGAHSVNLTIARIAAADDELMATAAKLSDEQMREQSLLPGWSRGHVLTHIARNADGLGNLLTWASTGIETPQYASQHARDEEIEAGAGRPAADLIEDVKSSSAAFVKLARELSEEAWAAEVRGLRGPAHPAWYTLQRRLTEVEIHHVDVAGGFTAANWPDWFLATMTYEVIGQMSANPAAPSAVLTDTASGRQYLLRPGSSGADDGGLAISGPGHELLAWLLGRGDGAGLTADPEGPLPAVPPY